MAVSVKEDHEGASTRVSATRLPELLRRDAVHGDYPSQRVVLPIVGDPGEADTDDLTPALAVPGKHKMRLL